MKCAASNRLWITTVYLSPFEANDFDGMLFLVRRSAEQCLITFTVIIETKNQVTEVWEYKLLIE